MVRSDVGPSSNVRYPMIILGVVLLLVYYLLLHVEILFILGLIAVVIGLVLLVLGFAGRPVGGRQYWY